MNREWTVTVNGSPLADVGLDEALLLWPDGQVTPVVGFTIYRGLGIIESLLAHYHVCRVYADENSLINNIPLRLH
jgi:hypothetical protein